jgi:hypothetical protein
MGALSRTMGQKSGQNSTLDSDSSPAVSGVNGTTNNDKVNSRDANWGKSVANMFEKGGSWDHNLRHEFAQLVSDREKEQVCTCMHTYIHL